MPGRNRLIPRLLPAFTVLELLTSLAFIVIVMGLMVSLARYVRADSADQLTRATLTELERALAQYREEFGSLPAVDVVPLALDERSLESAVLTVNQQVTRVLDSLEGTDLARFGTRIRDAWGRPIGYQPAQHPLIGMAPQNHPFFFSAGPDGKYLTRQDNLYSYEQTNVSELAPASSRLDSANNDPGRGSR